MKYLLLIAMLVGCAASSDPEPVGSPAGSSSSSAGSPEWSNCCFSYGSKTAKGKKYLTCVCLKVQLISCEDLSKDNQSVFKDDETVVQENCNAN